MGARLRLEAALILGARIHPLSTDTPTTEPDAKRPRVLMEKSDLILGDSGAAGGTDTSPSSSSPPSWWESGDARKIFAPCAVKYDSMECLRSIVLDRIELLESVNRNRKNWKMLLSQGLGAWRHAPTPNRTYTHCDCGVCTLPWPCVNLYATLLVT